MGALRDLNRQSLEQDKVSLRDLSKSKRTAVQAPKTTVPKVSTLDVVRGLPKAALKVGGAIADIAVKPFKTFTETTGGIIGEGIAYATNDDVRKAYDAGIDVLPTVTKTKQKELAKQTINAGVEAVLWNKLPPVLKQTPTIRRAGIGAIEGIGFTITDSIARGDTAEETVKKIPLGAIFGSGASVAAPWLTRQLSREVSLMSKTDKTNLKKFADKVPKTKIEEPVQVEQVVTQQAQEVVTPQRGVVEVAPEQLPVGEGKEKVSRLAQKMSDIDDPNVPTFKTSNQKKSIDRAQEYFTGKNDELLDVLEGRKSMPQGLDVETNALLPVLLSKTNELTPKQLVRAANARNIRSLAATRAGQEISILQQIDPDNPISAIADIVKARTARAERSGVTIDKARKTIKKEVRKEITKQQLKIQDAQTLLDDIELC